MKFKGSFLTDASGSIDGITASHNRGGKYIRARSIPVNPSSEFQQAVRNATSLLTSRWTGVVTEDQRAAWAVYAFNVPLPDAFGDPRSIPPLAMYNRCNVPRLQADPIGTDLPIVDDGPTDFTLGTFSEPSITGISAGTQLLSLAFDTGDDWVGEASAGMLVYLSRPQSVGINFFKGPYRFAAAILGDNITPPTSPVDIAVPFPVVAGQKLFAQIRVTRADGRLSSAQRFTAIVGA